MPIAASQASLSLLTFGQPLPWHPKNYPAGLMFPPGICLWADDNTPLDTLVSVDGEVVSCVVEAQLGPFGHVVQHYLTSDSVVARRTLTGNVEAWRSGAGADPALSGPASNDTLPA